jgi:hypothetical protein
VETPPPIDLVTMPNRTTVARVPSEAEGSGAKALTAKIEQLIHEGNVRRVVVRDKTGRKVLDLPVTAGVVVLALAPMITAAAGALALAGGWQVEVERTDPVVIEQRSEED